MNQRLHTQTGYLIIFVLIIIFAMTSIGIGIMTVVAAKYQHSSYGVSVESAVYAAEAGISDTTQQLSSNTTFTGWSSPRTLYNTTTRGKATYTTTVTTNSDGTVTIVSKGYVYRPGDTSPYDTKTVQATVKNPSSAYKLVSDIGGGYDMCATASSTAYCWGANFYGEAGNGSTGAVKHPSAVVTTGVLAGQKILTTQSSSVGDEASWYSCALGQNSSGIVAPFCWGINGAQGFLGNNSTTASYTPVAVNLFAVGSQPITNLGVGKDASCIVAGGKLYCWGDGGEGLMGNGTNNGFFKIPTAVTMTGALSGKTATQVAVSNTAYYVPDSDTGTLVDTSPPFACAVAYTTSASIDGQAYCWGDNSAYEAGTGTLSINTTPVHALGALTTKNVTMISPGYDYACAVASGQAYCWGEGNIGTGSGITKTPTLVSGGDMAGKTVTAISSGSTHTCAIASGQAYCWGSNINGESSYPTVTNNVSQPNLVPGFSGKTVTAIWASGTWYSSCAVAYTNSPSDSQMYCWGAAPYYLYTPNQNASNPALVDYSSASGLYNAGGGSALTILDYQQKYP